MTCIVGLVEDGKIYMGADRGMSDKRFIASSLTPKIRKIGPILIGYSASRGTGQLAHFVNYPKPDFNNVERWVRMDMCKALQEASEAYKVDISAEGIAADFLVGVGGKLFEVTTTDWSVTEYEAIATGSGYSYALGALHATSSYDISPRDRVKIALDAAIKYSPSCQSPIDLLVL